MIWLRGALLHAYAQQPLPGVQLHGSVRVTVPVLLQGARVVVVVVVVSLVVAVVRAGVLAASVVALLVAFLVVLRGSCSSVTVVFFRDICTAIAIGTGWRSSGS